MVKKIISFLLTWILVVCLCMPCPAAEISLEGKEQTTIDVYARCVSKMDREEIPVENGCAAIIVGDECRISVSSAPVDAVSIYAVSIPSSETAAWKWFSDCVGAEYNLMNIFDIYFDDIDGNRINANGAEIAISSVGNWIVMGVSKDGKVTELKSVFRDGQIIFTADGSDYYVLAEKRTDDLNNSPQAGKNNEIDSPRTGDEGHIGLWVVCLIGAIAVLLGFRVKKRKLFKDKN